VSLRVAKVPGSKWRLADWYVAHLPVTRVYLEPYFGSGAVLFNKPRSPTEVVNDIDGRVVALFRCLRDRPDDLARVVALTPWARDEWEACAATEDAGDDLELARQFLVVSHQTFGHKRGGWRHDGASGRIGRSVALGWADLPDRIMVATRRLQGVHIEHAPALELIRRYHAQEVCIFDDSPYLADSVHGERVDCYRHEMKTEAEHAEKLAVLLQHPGPVLSCGYRTKLYDDMLLGAGWVVAEAAAMGEGGAKRVECAYLNPQALAGRQLHLGVAWQAGPSATGGAA